ncbi:hypothetical protein [Mucilaginibacter glaciei]|uniref:Uncharacterized protein n=1 Tax=Mucilaginibacter glaciei TaxID=2772109 RepID=A0A926NRP9_9SPHI|nr:hypothetical protein [Mucilaginibacter glaciei]MBD1392685.1 hypothetical protein [Mucilaginibacter glaciei]
MRTRKKLNIFIPLVVLIFCGAYAKHRLIDNKQLPEGRLQDKAMDEISGISASGVNQDVYYVHNDSGDTSRFFAITADGKLRSTIYYKADATTNGVYDCEDIAVGPGPVKGKSYVYLGDIGDNAANRNYVTINRVEEQNSWDKDSIAHATQASLYLKYPFGARDAEAMMVDPVEKLLYIVTKRYDSVEVYTTPLNFKAKDTVTLSFHGRLFFKGIKPFKWITAGDISKKGDEILLKSYEKIYYWERKPGEHIWETLQRAPLEPTYKQEKQGEAIGFTPDGRGYYTTSEGVYSPIYYYPAPGRKVY